MRKIDVAAKRKKILQQWEKRYCSNDAITAAAMSKRGNRNLFHNCFAPVSHLQWSANDRVPSQMRDVLSGWENSSADIKNFSADAKALRWWDHLWADEIICKQTRDFVSKCDKSSLNVRICQQMRDLLSMRDTSAGFGWVVQPLNEAQTQEPVSHLFRTCCTPISHLFLSSSPPLLHATPCQYTPSCLSVAAWKCRPGQNNWCYNTTIRHNIITWCSHLTGALLLSSPRVSLLLAAHWRFSTPPMPEQPSGTSASSS